jgi:hypothetical protein
MPRIIPFAEVVGEEDVSAPIADARRERARKAGKPAGRKFSELKGTGGRPEEEIPLAEADVAILIRLSEIFGDPAYERIAKRGSVTVPFGHLRNVASDTEIVCGYSIEYTFEESQALLK